MDEMLIRSKFTKKIIAKIIEKEIKKKTNLDANIEFGDISIKIDDNVNFELSAKGNIPKEVISLFMRA